MSRRHLRSTTEPERPRLAVELLRVSGQAQADRDTPEDQRRALAALHELRGGTIVATLDDGTRTAISGNADCKDRPDIQRLLQLAERRAFTEVRVKRLDRLTRHASPLERFTIFEAVKRAGAIFVTAGGQEIDPATREGEIIFFLDTHMASAEREAIVERTQAGRRRHAELGNIQGKPPYGLIWTKPGREERVGTWREHPTQMPFLRRLFSDVAAGNTLNALAEAYSAEGLTTRTGAPWSSGKLSQLMKNRAAIGEIHGWGQIIRCPPAVDRATWDAAHAMLRKNRRPGRAPGSVSVLLRRIACCGHCGARMVIESGAISATAHGAYYVCGRHRETDEIECKRWHRVQIVDAAFREHLQKRLDEDPAALWEALTKRQAAEEASDPSRAIAKARRDLRALEWRQEATMRRIGRGLLSESVGDRQLEEIRIETNAATAALAEAEARAASSKRATADRKQIEAAAVELRKIVRNATTEELGRVLARMFRAPGEGVRLHPSGDVELTGGWSPALTELPASASPTAR